MAMDKPMEMNWGIPVAFGIDTVQDLSVLVLDLFLIQELLLPRCHSNRVLWMEVFWGKIIVHSIRLTGICKKVPDAEILSVDATQTAISLSVNTSDSCICNFYWDLFVNDEFFMSLRMVERDGDGNGAIAFSPSLKMIFQSFASLHWNQKPTILFT